jgi:hypothetical protein
VATRLPAPAWALVDAIARFHPHAYRADGAFYLATNTT